MSLTVKVLRCPRCEKRYRVRNPVAGRVYRCTACQERLCETDDSSGTDELDSVHTTVRAGPGSPGTPAPDTRRLSRTTPTAGAGAGAGGEEPALPGRIGNYRILSRVGQGGMGIVYRARDEALNRIVAIKVLRARELGKGKALERFHQEAQAIARLRHPNIVQVFAYDSDERFRYFVMEFVEGDSLDVLIERNFYSLEEKVVLFRDLASALAYAHSQKVIHRDIKPSNVLVDTQGKPILTDFGLAKEIDRVTDLTQEGAAIGTPYYMAPEQLEGRIHEIDQRSDIYSLGVLFFELLTGTKPFRAESKAELYLKVMSTDPTFSVRHQKTILPELRAICLKAMRRNSAERYQSAEDLIEDIERHIAGDRVHAGAGPARVGRRRILLVAIVAGFALVAGGALFWRFAPGGGDAKGHGVTPGAPGPVPGDGGKDPSPDQEERERLERARREVDKMRRALLEGEPYEVGQALSRALEYAGSDADVLGELRKYLSADPDAMGKLVDIDPRTYARCLHVVFPAGDETLESFRRENYSRARDLYLDGEYKEAERHADRVLALFPDDFLVRRVRGNVYLKEKEHERAIAEFVRLRGTPVENEVLWDLALCYAKLGRTEEALAALREHLDRFPGDGKGYHLRGTIEYERKNFSAALGDFEKAVERQVINQEILEQMSVSAQRLGRLKQSLYYQAGAGTKGGEEYAAASAQRMTQITNLLLEALAPASAPPYVLDLGPMPPRGNVLAKANVAWLFPDPPTDWGDHSNWVLKLTRCGESSIQIWFDLPEVPRPLWLHVEHVSSGSAEGNDGRVTLTINDHALATEAEIAGKGKEPYEAEITPFCRVGTNVLTWRFASDARTHYWLQKVEIASR